MIILWPLRFLLMSVQILTIEHLSLTMTAIIYWGSIVISSSHVSIDDNLITTLCTYHYYPYFTGNDAEAYRDKIKQTKQNKKHHVQGHRLGSGNSNISCPISKLLPSHAISPKLYALTTFLVQRDEHFLISTFIFNCKLPEVRGSLWTVSLTAPHCQINQEIKTK